MNTEPRRPGDSVAPQPRRSTSTSTNALRGGGSLTPHESPSDQAAPRSPSSPSSRHARGSHALFAQGPGRAGLFLLGYPRAGEATAFEWRRCQLCSERVLETERIFMFSDVLKERAHLCLACAEDQEGGDRKLTAREECTDAMAAWEERHRERD